MKKFIFLSILFIPILRVVAQDPYYVQIDKTQGLPSNSVYNIFQDSRGFIWMAHNEGLSRYDGHEFITYSCSQQTSKAGSYIKEDLYGRIWYRNFDGYLYYVANDTMHALTMDKPFGFSHYGVMGKTLLVIQPTGAQYYDLHSLQKTKHIPFNTELFGGSLQAGNIFYLQINRTVFRLNDQGLRDSLRLPDSSFMKIGLGCASKNGVLMFSRQNINQPCYEMDGFTLTKKFNHPPASFTQGAEYASGFYWLCTTKGVYGYDESGNSLNHSVPFFGTKNISHAFCDRKGNYWFATPTEGVLFVPHLSTRLISMPEFKPNRIAFQKGKLYVGTRDGQLLQLNLSDLKKEVLYTNNHELLQLYADPARNAVFFTSGEFNLLQGKQLLNFGSYATKEVVKVDDMYYAYTSTGNSGLIRSGYSKKHSEWDSAFNKYVKSDDPRFSVLVGKNSRGKSVANAPGRKSIYFATNIGLYCVSPQETKELSLKGQPVYAMRLQEYNNRVFALTTQGNLFEINQDHSFLSIHTGTEPIKNIKICGSYLFLMNDNNLFYVDLREQKFRIQQISNTITGDEINDLTLAGNKLLLAINKGIIISDFFVNSAVKTKPPFIITRLSVNNQLHSVGIHNSFRANENDIELHYSILEFCKDEYITCFYRINNSEWNATPKGSRSLKFASLSPGNYTIAFKLGDFEPEQSTVQFTINKPYWMQWWFMAGVALSGIIIIFMYYKWRVQSITKQNKLLLEKTELEKNLGQYMLTAIKSQMNPHFFYNALNTIQSYIFSNDKKQASSYLNKFSNLTRMILEMSEKETVRLEEEIKALLLYLELEKSRFESDFNFTINIDKSVDTEMIRIPSMLIQPYVENAIKHGLLHKPGNKELHISFLRHENDLMVEVSDNGIGRKQAAERNRHQVQNHNSFSTVANSKRLEILNRGRRNSIGVVYHDHFIDNNQASGTTVNITIPINA